MPVDTARLYAVAQRCATVAQVATTAADTNKSAADRFAACSAAVGACLPPDTAIQIDQLLQDEVEEFAATYEAILDQVEPLIGIRRAPDVPQSSKAPAEEVTP